MKTLKMYALMGTVIAAIFLVSCSKDEADDTFYSAPANVVSNDFSDQEKAGLILLVEKEKLHRDVYMAMANNCQLPLVGELCSCDENYMNLLSIKIDKYGLTNPLVGKEAGEYHDTNVQAVYDDFIENCGTGQYSMMQFAKLMEENDLDIIYEQLEIIEGNTDVMQLYVGLKDASVKQLNSIKDELELHANNGIPEADVDEF